MRLGLFAFSIFVLANSVVAQETKQRLDLSCRGSGTAMKSTSDFVYGHSSTGSSAWGTIDNDQIVGFEDNVKLWVDGEKGKIALPRIILPPFHGGTNSWFNLSDLRVTSDAITATARVNFMNHPKIEIDRRVGSISISGPSGHFSGICQRFDPDDTHRAF